MCRILLVMLIISLSGVPVFSANQPDVKVTLSAHRVTKNVSGKERVSPGDSANPGEIIEYRATYRNNGGGAALTMAGTLPVPKEMEYVPESARPASAHASVDGVNYSTMPLKRKVKLPNGTVANREVPVAEYISLRWNLKDLAPGASVTVTARMKIKDNQQGPVIIKLDSVNKSEGTQKGGEK